MLARVIPIVLGCRKAAISAFSRSNSFRGSPMRMLLALLIAGVTTAAAASLEACEPLKAMTFNVRLASAADGDHVWTKRSDLALKVIEDEDPAVLCVQEAQRVQLD